MKRVVVVGSTGSGKSTLARALANKCGLKYIELDFLFWKPKWEQASDEEFFAKIERELADQERWVVDGNYARSNHLIWNYADTIVWIDLSLGLTLYQNITRSFKRVFTREEIWKGTGNRESLWRMFSRDSIVIWLLKTYRGNVDRYEQRMQDPRYAHLRFVRLKSRQEIEKFLASLPES